MEYLGGGSALDLVSSAVFFFWCFFRFLPMVCAWHTLHSAIYKMVLYPFNCNGIDYGYCLPYNKELIRLGGSVGFLFDFHLLVFLSSLIFPSPGC